LLEARGRVAAPDPDLAFDDGALSDRDGVALEAAEHLAGRRDLDLAPRDDVPVDHARDDDVGAAQSSFPASARRERDRAVDIAFAFDGAAEHVRALAEDLADDPRRRRDER